MAEHLTFTSESKAIAAQRQIWINEIKKRASEGENLVGTGEVHYTDLSGLTNEQISQLKIYSKRNGNEDVDPSLIGTEGYAEVKKAFELDKWHIPKPSEDLMEGVVDYAIEPYDANWEEPWET